MYPSILPSIHPGLKQCELVASTCRQDWECVSDYKTTSRSSLVFCVNVCVGVCVCAFPLSKANSGCQIEARAANTPQVAVWDRPGRPVTVCSPSPASFICNGSGQNAISCKGGWPGGCGRGRGARNIKGSWKLSGTWALPAPCANSPALAYPAGHPNIS